MDFLPSFSEFSNKLKKNKNQIVYTKFSAVRFGNVVDSSGSVIPIFRQQIKTGGPITVTHPDMERFFMTISEAVQLVLQSSVLTNGGETFILNMGQPVKIIEIAKKMIFASGLEIRDNKNKNGDIEIKIIGIKKGEKFKISNLSFKKPGSGIPASEIDNILDKVSNTDIEKDQMIKKEWIKH